MNISVCITTLNEESTIGALLDSLLAQTRKPGSIVIVDSESSDRTVEIIRHYQRKDGRTKLLVEKCSRAKGRNLAIEIAKGDIIAMTDAGCAASKNWLERITGPLSTSDVEVVAGFYKMEAKNSFEKAESVFLGVMPGDFDVEFLPSARSMAFRRDIWQKVGGFPENLEGAAEDTVFNYKLIKAGAKFSRMKSAVVEWGMPAEITNFYFSIFNYAKGDARSKIWFFPGKGITSHNIKALFVVLRYLLAVILLILALNHPLLPYLLLMILLFYIFWAYRKIFIKFGEVEVALWGPVLQIVSDFGVMAGFLLGIFGKK
jgi:glycosyltransferase involved in cell wall biosynthesis